MSLWLVEANLTEENLKPFEVKGKAEGIQLKLEHSQSALVEVQFSKNFTQAFFIIEAEDVELAKRIVEEEKFSVKLAKEVRLVGEELEKVKKEKDVVNYLVEWNLPEELTMDQYLTRKKQNSVHYEEVPEVEFARTYVCEDMTKCLCFYDAPDEAAVTRAREAVKAPVDSITELRKDNE